MVLLLMIHVQGCTVASGSLSLIKSMRTAWLRKSPTKESKPTKKLGGSGFSVPSPNDNCKGGIDSEIGGGLLIDSGSSSDAANEDGNDNSTPGICRLDKNNNKY